MRTVGKSMLVILAIAGGAFLPAIFGGSGLVYSVFVLIAILTVMAYGLDLVVSDIGEVSLAHPVFFAVGAYSTGLVAPIAGPFFSWAAALAGSTALAFGIGLCTLRLRDFAFSVVTYAVGVVAITIAQNWTFLGGSDGISGIPPFSVAFGPWTFEASTDAALWWVAYPVLIAVIYIVDRFRRSKLGYAAVSGHLNVRLATMSGINTKRVRLLVFTLSAPITATAGWLYGYQRSYVSADVMDTYFLILTLTAVVLIGRRVLLGPLIATAIILAQEKLFSFGGNADKIILGVTLVSVLACVPQGIATALADFVRDRRASSDAGADQAGFDIFNTRSGRRPVSAASTEKIQRNITRDLKA